MGAAEGASAVSKFAGESEARSTARGATSDEIALLNEVLQKTAQDYRRWAYTEHLIIKDEKGRVKTDTLLRYDPSQPYPEQWTPIKISGRDPTDRERAKYRKRGEKGAPAPGVLPGGPGQTNSRISLGEAIEVGKSSIASETATHLVFEVPLRKVGNERFPPEKFQVLVRIKKQERLLENISVNLRDSFRAKLVVKVKSGDASLDFAPVNPKYPAALVAIEGDAQASLLFVKLGGSMSLKRTDLKHVKLYDERFDVQVGTLKAIDF
jgi:hypothetical protein